MKPFIALLAGLFLPFSLHAANYENGHRINKTCALCHGQYAQGTSGRLSPRLAGLPTEYLVKAIKEYKDGKRINPTMMTTSGIDAMSDQDIEDIAAFLNAIDMDNDPRFDILASFGDTQDGKKEYKECKSCHGKDGYGDKEKNIPQLAGQHAEYVFQSVKMFQARQRVHDNDPKDELFDEYDDQALMNITAYTASLDDANFKQPKEVFMPKVDETKLAKMEDNSGSVDTGLRISDISQTVAQMQLKKGVSIPDAIEAMMSKAVELNMKLVGRQDVSKEIEARGEKMPYLSILQFCNPADAKIMVIHNPIYASYMPCRIAVVEDQQGNPWLMMLNLDMLINSKLLPPEVVEMAIKVNQNMLDIMVAGAKGEF